MHIKQVTIEGFKTYKEQTVSETFSPKINVVVGANGSGKSNFFHAIRFVLNDIFASLRQEERAKLLHEGAGHAVSQAYVEMVFDNSDGRLPVDKDEVRLRRTIGLKRDEYHLDKRHITKSEVMNLLETAGFSRANPYYVVQQGKIMKMSSMKDPERLELLKEIGGTRVYEERRKESLGILQETGRRRQRIQEVMCSLDEKLAELDEERAELAAYQSLDRTRRSVEYSLYDREVTEAKKKLEQVEKQLEEAAAHSGRVQEEAREAKSALRKVEKELAATKEAQEALRSQQGGASGEKAAALGMHAALQADVRELQERQKGQGSQHKAAEAEVRRLEGEVAAKEKELQEAQQALEDKQAQESEAAKGLAESERRLQALFQKQGRQAQFGSEAERDAWVDKELQALEGASRQKQRTQQQLQQQIASLEGDETEMKQAVSAKEQEIAAQEAELSSCEARLKDAQSDREGLLSKRKELWKKEADTDSELKSALEERNKRSRAVERAVPRDINRGLNSVKRIVREQKISGVHGVLMELFQCPPQLNLAVEVTARNQLFQLVVDNEDTAIRLAEVLNRDKAGRATFMPLNKIVYSEAQYPQQYGTDAIPLVNRLKFDAKYTPAMMQVFGKTLVCKDMDVATDVARSCRLNCVTLDGDEANRKGTLSGGFHDAKRSRLEAMHGLKEVTSAHERLSDTLRETQAALCDLDGQCGRVEGEVQKLEARRVYLRGHLSTLRGELSSLQQRGEALGKQMEGAARQLAQVQESAAQLQQQMAGLRAEKGTALLAQLTQEERDEVAGLGPAIDKAKEELIALRAARMGLKGDVDALQQRLGSHLRKALRQARESLADLDPQALSEALRTKRSEEADACARLRELSDSEAAAASQLMEADARCAELAAEADRLRDLVEKEAQLAQDDSGSVESLAVKRSALTQRRGDYEKKIRELGSLPSEAFEKYSGKSSKALHELLSKTSQQLKSLGGVNLKAMDQYNSFVQQRQELLQRQTDNDKSEEKIKQLIQTLDLRKDEAIERTFKGVAKHFREIFAELAPGGRGELVMQRRVAAAGGASDEAGGAPDDGGEEGGEDGAGGQADGPMDKYVGVKVKVSFGMGETMSLKQLSGGQKTLVALALIFAIQRCDPAPFYLFDEIDAALDPQYRTTVAKMLKKQADDPRVPAQFIVTTFHPQIVMMADKVYGVSHTNRISRIDVIAREDALEFLSAEEARMAQQHHKPRQQQRGGGGGGASSAAAVDEDDDE